MDPRMEERIREICREEIMAFMEQLVGTMNNQPPTSPEQKP